MYQDEEGEIVQNQKRGIDLHEIAMVVLRGWRILAITVAVFVVLTLVGLHTSPSVFAVRMVVTQVQGAGDQGASRATSLSSLAQLAGLNLGPSAGQSASQFRYYLDSLHSRDLANELAKNQDLMKTIFSSEWDEQTQSWREPKHGMFAKLIRGVFWLLGSRPLPWSPPDGAQLQEYLFQPGSLEVGEDIKRPDHATIEVDSANPEFAIKLLNTVNSTANEHLRKKALLRATQYINYLSGELSTVTVAEHREAIMRALSEQEKFKMSADSGAPYAADVFDKPSVALKRLAPRPSQAYPVAIMKGLLVGAVIVLLLEFFGDRIRYFFVGFFGADRVPVALRRPLGLHQSTEL